MLKKIISILFMLFMWNAVEAAQPLPPEKAFAMTTSFNAERQLIVKWQMAPGYFLYENQIHFTVLPPSQIKLDPIQLPMGEPRVDDIHGHYQIYQGTLVVPISMPEKGFLNLEIAYQGCSSGGFCYAPMKKFLRLNLTEMKGPQDVTEEVVVAGQRVSEKLSGQSYTEKFFETKNRAWLLLAFFGLGLLLAFTPCVLPMVPILSSIILGHKHHLTLLKAFLLSLSYVLGMAFTYAIAGMVVATLGSSVQAALEKTGVIVFFSVLFTVLALSLLGFYEMHLPSRWHQKITKWSHYQKSGTYIGVFIMGSLSTLIVSPCVSAPLVGVLAYIAQTGDVFLGGLALLVLGLGMGTPLLLLGMSAGKLLPRSGAWMKTLQKFIGVLMLAMAIWILSRVAPGQVILFLSGILLIYTSLLLGLFTRALNDWGKLRRSLGLISIIYGMILVSGALMGNKDFFHPWEGWGLATTDSSHMQKFFLVKNEKDLTEQLAEAKKNKKWALLDFYADWCTSCVIMDREIFADPKVQAALHDVVLLRANVTENSEADRQLLKQFNVIAPPTILFFNRDSHEIKQLRIVGEVNSKEFLTHIKKLEE